MEEALKARRSQLQPIIEAARFHQVEAKFEHLRQAQTDKERIHGNIGRQLQEERERRHQLEHELNNLRTQEDAWLKEWEKLIGEREADQQVNQDLQAQLVTPPHTTS
jgi:chromosome segregation ATPase